jgi:hypothetical protein
VPRTVQTSFADLKSGMWCWVVSESAATKS